MYSISERLSASQGRFYSVELGKTNSGPWTLYRSVPYDVFLSLPIRGYNTERQDQKQVPETASSRLQAPTKH